MSGSIREAYEHGKGPITVRGKAFIEGVEEDLEDSEASPSTEPRPKRPKKKVCPLPSTLTSAHAAVQAVHVIANLLFACMCHSASSAPNSMTALTNSCHWASSACYSRGACTSETAGTI